ncbi:MAG: aminotransferase class IV [Bacteroidales bacterium]
MSELTGHTFIFNGNELPIDQYDKVDDLLKKHPSIYEVVRIEEGVPLFLEDYLHRLENSFATISKVKSYSDEEIASTIYRLIKINKHESGPVKLIFGTDRNSFFFAYLMRPHLPKPHEYISGVKTIFLEEERKNPTAKVWNESLRNKSVKLIEDTQVYEAILVNESGFITEASRSNVFFIRNDIVYTTPSDIVLPGITRKKVLKVCEQNKINVEFKALHKKDLPQYESCFLTGTARRIVPVRQINDQQFSVEKNILHRIIAGFDKMVLDYIQKKKKEK